MPEPLGLRDVIKIREVVDLGNGASVEVRGVGFRFIAKLLDEYETARVLMGEGDLRPLSILRSAPDAAEALMAKGLAIEDEPEIIAEVSDWPWHKQITVIEGILRATFGGDLDPFVERLLSCFGLQRREVALPSPVPNGRDSDMTSQQPSSV